MFKDIFDKDLDKIYIIAEIGINHNGDLKKAVYLINRAKAAGADAVKFQTFKSELLVSQRAPKMPYQIRTPQERENQFDMLKKMELDREQHIELINYCRKLAINFISTPYDTDSADMLAELGVEVLKVASTDTTNIPFLRHLKFLNIPLIVSTGVTDIEELKKAMEIFVHDESYKIALLHCISNYPAPPEELNLRCIRGLEEIFSWPVGFSDHTASVDTGAYAACAGAHILEKHFTFDKNASGPDHAASLEPDELKLYISKVREVEKCLGDGEKRITASERNIKPHMQKSIVARYDIAQGQIITESNLWTMRPATGISPLSIDQLIGKKLRRPKLKFQQIAWEDLEDA